MGLPIRDNTLYVYLLKIILVYVGALATVSQLEYWIYKVLVVSFILLRLKKANLLTIISVFQMF